MNMVVDLNEYIPIDYVEFDRYNEYGLFVTGFPVCFYLSYNDVVCLGELQDGRKVRAFFGHNYYIATAFGFPNFPAIRRFKVLAESLNAFN